MSLNQRVTFFAPTMLCVSVARAFLSQGNRNSAPLVQPNELLSLAESPVCVSCCLPLVLSLSLGPLPAPVSLSSWPRSPRNPPGQSWMRGLAVCPTEAIISKYSGWEILLEIFGPFPFDFRPT